jgi:hypothetical protein
MAGPEGLGLEFYFCPGIFLYNDSRPFEGKRMTYLRPGPKSKKDTNSEETVMISLMVTKREKDFISSQGMPMSQFVRNLIDTEMALRGIDINPEKVDTTVLKGMEMIMSSLRESILVGEEQ